MKKISATFIYIRRFIWQRVKPFSVWLSKLIGVHLLDKNQTKDYLKSYQLSAIPGYQSTLPTVVDASDFNKILFKDTPIRVEPSYVWRVEIPDKNATMFRCGSILLNHKLLLTDYTHDAFLNPFIRNKRKPYQAKTLIAPWSQYFEHTPPGYQYHRYIKFGGYYDFVMLLAAKLSRIKDALSEEVLSQSIIAYPLLNTAYEQDFLALLGFKPDQILDSRLHSASFDTCVLGDSDSWCYPNVADLLSLKKNVEERLQVERTNQNRIYVRRAGRRRVLNEEDLIRLLEQYDFTIIDDVPRPVAEQVSIYRNATFILGPHGASFTNIIWCEPGTHLFELFNADYVPNYYLYLSQMLSMQYSAYCFGKPVSNSDDALSADIIISVSEVDKCLQKLLVTS